MRTLTFGDAALRDLSRGHRAQRDFQDTIEDGLYDRVGALKKTFFTSTRIGGKREFKTLGHYPATSIDKAREAASKQAREWQALREGVQVAAPSDVPTLQQATERHIAESNDLRRRHHKRPLQSADLMRAALKFHFPKHWNEPVTAITAQVIASKYRDIPGRTLACLRAVLRISVGDGMKNPLIRLPRGTVGAHGTTDLIPELRKDPKRLKDVVRAIRAYPSHELRVFAEMMLFTGRRPGELRCLRWQDADLARGVYSVRSHKTASNDQDFILAPLSQHLVTLLTTYGGYRAANPRHDGRYEFVFPASQADTFEKCLSISGYRGVGKHVRKACKFDDFTVYQLRKMFVSTCENLNMAANSAHLLTGHAIAGARGSYSFSVAEMLKPALEQVTAKLNEYVNAAS
jgi:integrase